ncbi:MAG: VacJ family lipoprotein [Desulfatibacillaceae bacterium]|nr:VacJ family lipoprotein [Desulfatibacillaceae bacterium]
MKRILSSHGPKAFWPLAAALCLALAVSGCAGFSPPDGPPPINQEPLPDSVIQPYGGYVASLATDAQGPASGMRQDDLQGPGNSDPDDDAALLDDDSALADDDLGLLDDDLDFLDDEDPSASVHARAPDPLEGFNRAMFTFNDRMYFWVVKPSAEVYNKITPRQARISISNFFRNALFPVRFVNCVFQGRANEAGAEFAAFLINSTVGIVGLRDMTSHDPRFPKSDRDMGQTFATYGMGHGIYIVWPILGPSSLRDSAGLVGDYFLNPIAHIDPAWASSGLSAFGYFNNASLRVGNYEAFKEMSLDPYVGLRNAYLQNRAHKIEQGAIGR